MIEPHLFMFVFQNYIYIKICTQHRATAVVKICHCHSPNREDRLCWERSTCSDAVPYGETTKAAWGRQKKKSVAELSCVRALNDVFKAIPHSLPRPPLFFEREKAFVTAVMLKTARPVCQNSVDSVNWTTPSPRAEDILAYSRRFLQSLWWFFFFSCLFILFNFWLFTLIAKHLFLVVSETENYFNEYFNGLLLSSKLFALGSKLSGFCCCCFQFENSACVSSLWIRRLTNTH